MEIQVISLRVILQQFTRHLVVATPSVSLAKRFQEFDPENFHRSKHSLALFPSPSLVLWLKRKHHSVKWQSGELAKGEGSGMSGEAEKFLGNKMERCDGLGSIFSSIVVPLKSYTTSPSSWSHQRP